MTIEVVWDNDDKTIIRYVLAGQWTWDDMIDAVEVSNKMLDTVDYPVHFIYDARESAGVPGGAISQLKRFVGKEHPNTGRSVVVGGERSMVVRLGQSIISLVEKVYKANWKFQFADNLDTARALLLEAHDEALDKD